MCLGSSKFAVHSFQGFVPSRTFHIQADCTLHTIINLQRTSDILPLWGAYIEYPLPTEWGTCAMATGISENIDSPHVKDSLSLWAQTKPLSLSHLCLY